MKKFSDKLKKNITAFMLAEIGSSGLDGMTYCLYIKNSKNEETYQKYIEIREEADRCGYSKDEVFRVFELVNGYIFDVDMSTMMKTLVDVAKASIKATGKNQELLEKVYREPESVRDGEMKRLASLVIKSVEAGNASLEVAMFNKNISNKAGFTVDNNGKKEYVSLPAFRVRHWDIRKLNEEYLMNKGYRVRRVVPKYIIGSSNAVHTTLEVERV